MPTKKRRVGFIPRIVVLEIIKKLSYENNLSNSKIINILVEEALSQRGIFDIKTGIANFRLERENEKKDVYSFLRNNRIKNKNTGLLNRGDLASEETIDEILDSEVYQKFLLFLQFQEKMKNNNSN